jgi:hypothetical protein
MRNIARNRAKNLRLGSRKNIGIEKLFKEYKKGKQLL